MKLAKFDLPQPKDENNNPVHQETELLVVEVNEPQN